MNKPTKIPTVQDELDAMDAARPKGVYAKLMAARSRFHRLQLKKSGKNAFAGYSYFELGDFLIPALQVFHEVGLCALPISFTADLATMTIVDLDSPADRIVFTSPMGSAALKGCHEVQNIGAVETYQRRYLWVAALEIVEHDAIDKTTGKEGFSTGETPPNKRVPLAGPYTSKTQLWAAVKAFVHAGNGMGDLGEWIAYRDSKDVQELLEQCKRDAPGLWSEGLPDVPEYEPLEVFIARRTRELEQMESLQGAK